ncbi:MAG: hypothetical protein IH944_07470 [Armatimonadetes bacterium]|nr:hypothetical protein [Armatimonadota bacterium]
MSAATLGQQQDPAFALRWMPKVGEKQVFEIFLSIEAPDSPALVVEAAMESEVIKVSPKEYAVRTRSLGALFGSGGQQTRDDRPNTREIRFTNLGELIEIASGNKAVASYQQAMLTRFISPENPPRIREGWVVERKKDNPKGLAQNRIEYKLLGIEQGGAKVSFSFREIGPSSPQSAEGHWWVDVATGQPNRMECTVKNFLGVAGSTATIKMTRRVSG